jgi:hypothetical protein
MHVLLGRWKRGLYVTWRSNATYPSLPGPPKPTLVGTWQGNEYKEPVNRCDTGIADPRNGGATTARVPGKKGFVFVDSAAGGRPIQHRPLQCIGPIEAVELNRGRGLQPGAP